MLVLEDLVGLHRMFIFSFFSVTGQGIDLDYHDIEWFALEMEKAMATLSSTLAWEIPWMEEPGRLQSMGL